MALNSRTAPNFFANNCAAGSDSEWKEIFREHEIRKWSCLSALLPVVLGEAAPGRDQIGQDLSLSGIVQRLQHVLKVSTYTRWL